jgi:hypothetical protein
MKRLVWLCALVLLASGSSHPGERSACDTTGTAETICITSEFAVEIEYPNFVVSILAHLTGAHIERLTLVEWDIRTPVLSSFLLQLTEGESRWLEIASDSAYPSFVKLPREDRTLITAGALNFIKDLIRFFQGPRADTLHAVFEYSRATLRARAFQQFASIDSGSHVTTVSRVETWNALTGEDYINGEVTAVTQEGYTAYPDIRISLKHKDITMRFNPLHVGVVRSTQ